MDCPVCGLAGMPIGRTKDYGELQELDCQRCGYFAITGSALAVLPHRLRSSPNAATKLSHQLRSASDAGNHLTVNTSNLDDLLAAPLPSPAEQMRLLIQVIRSHLDGESFDWVKLGSKELNAAVATVGVRNPDSLDMLIGEGARRGYLQKKIDMGGGGTLVSVTGPGWELLDRVEQPSTANGPAPSGARNQPTWLPTIEDEALRTVLAEVYRASADGLLSLPVMGARTAFDRAMFLLVGDPPGGFDGKLRAMVAAGHITEDEIGILKPMIDAGSAAAHRGWLPTPAILSAMMDELEHKLRDWFVRRLSAEAVRAATPPRGR